MCRTYGEWGRETGERCKGFRMGQLELRGGSQHPLVPNEGEVGGSRSG